MSFIRGRIGGWNITGKNLQGASGGTTIELKVTAKPFIEVTADRVKGKMTKESITSTGYIEGGTLNSKGAIKVMDGAAEKSGLRLNMM